MSKSPESVFLFFDEIALAAGADSRLDTSVLELRRTLGDVDQSSARYAVERMAVAFQASLLVRHGPTQVADAFVASRVSGERGAAFGTLPPGTQFEAIVSRTTPVL